MRMKEDSHFQIGIDRKPCGCFLVSFSTILYNSDEHGGHVSAQMRRFDGSNNMPRLTLKV